MAEIDKIVATLKATGPGANVLKLIAALEESRARAEEAEKQVEELRCRRETEDRLIEDIASELGCKEACLPSISVVAIGYKERAEDAEKQVAVLKLQCDAVCELLGTNNKGTKVLIDAIARYSVAEAELTALKGQESAAEAWERAIKQAAHQASWFSGRPGARVHPDIPWEQMNESAKTAAHSTAQQIAMEIEELSYTPLPPYLKKR